ncbi:hypothetical protein HAY23_004537 [Salmonella enterica]|uniref:Uncharacterized protein n=3 Tax=Salmonella enterica TaxID=28901 RepID=A0A3V4IW73_SALER|nr:hypothetical protein ELZ76_14525 [Salmonella enterica subsp. salamae serovar 42:r:-]EAA7842910.1 hypothetical protein [Salmonella enterica]ECC3554045.1 hypothetical protein [Salmonella enterica subsp. salamae]HCM1853276.1 hypothetical protein [Salmonella enterica subsp. salamae serovar 42:z29:-]AZT52992.1 hypothetical protein EL003_14495 [Salmonella enterica subsp. salamae serovar 42:r:-]
MKHTDDPLDKNPLKEMNKEEIFSLFAGYEFRDQHGHDLLNCVHFEQLVELATTVPTCGE